MCNTNLKADLRIIVEGSSQFIVSGFFGDEKKLGSFLCRIFPLVIGCYLLVSKKEINKKTPEPSISFSGTIWGRQINNNKFIVVFGHN